MTADERRKERVRQCRALIEQHRQRHGKPPRSVAITYAPADGGGFQRLVNRTEDHDGTDIVRDCTGTWSLRSGGGGA